jgi:hypothetical protein
MNPYPAVPGDHALLAGASSRSPHGSRKEEERGRDWIFSQPLFDTNKNAWEFAVTKKFTEGDTVKGTYAASTKLFSLEWSRNSIAGSSFKVCASASTLLLILVILLALGHILVLLCVSSICASAWTFLPVFGMENFCF